MKLVTCSSNNRPDFVPHKEQRLTRSDRLLTSFRVPWVCEPQRISTTVTRNKAAPSVFPCQNVLRHVFHFSKCHLVDWSLGEGQLSICACPGDASCRKDDRFRLLLVVTQSVELTVQLISRRYHLSGERSSRKCSTSQQGNRTADQKQGVSAPDSGVAPSPTVLKLSHRGGSEPRAAFVLMFFVFVTTE